MNKNRHTIKFIEYQLDRARSTIASISGKCVQWGLNILSLLLLFLCLGCAPTLEQSDSGVLGLALLEVGNTCYEQQALDAAQLNNYYQMQQVLNGLNQNMLLQQQNSILQRRNMGLRY